MCEKCPYSEFFWSVFSYIWTRKIPNTDTFQEAIIIAQKMKFSIKNFFSKYDQIRRNLRIWSHLLQKSLMENFVFCAVNDDNQFNDKQVKGSDD